MTNTTLLVQLIGILLGIVNALVMGKLVMGL